jgi:hypothetical protein
MKRCPECLFIYPESDSLCDFDNTPLVVVDDAELEAATSPTAPSPAKVKSKRAPRKRQRKVVTFIAALVVSVVAFVVYLAIAQRRQADVEMQPIASVAAVPVATPAVESLVESSASSSVVEVASPSPSPSATPKVLSDRIATSHSSATAAPVSTSGPGMGKKLGGKPVILLTSGGKIDADEVWRTRDGVWYRRAGIVTLLKPGRVKSIVNH